MLLHGLNCHRKWCSASVRTHQAVVITVKCSSLYHWQVAGFVIFENKANGGKTIVFCMSVISWCLPETPTCFFICAAHSSICLCCECVRGACFVTLMNLLVLYLLPQALSWNVVQWTLAVSLERLFYICWAISLGWPGTTYRIYSLYWWSWLKKTRVHVNPKLGMGKQLDRVKSETKKEKSWQYLLILIVYGK